MNWKSLTLVGIALIVLLYGTVLVFEAFDRNSHSASDTIRPFVITMGPVWALAIVAATAVSPYVLPEMLERFVAEHPRVEVSVRTGHSEDVVELVLRDEVQIGLGQAIRHPDLELRPFHTEDLVLVCAPSHAFTKRPSVAMAEGAGQKLIMFDRTSSYYEITQGAFLSAGVSLRGMMELDSIEAAKKMAERGLGVALLPGTAVAREVEGGTLCLVKM